MRSGLLVLAYVLAMGIFPIAAAMADDGSGLKIGANGDIVGNFGLSDSTIPNTKLQVREAELMIYAPIDHLFDGVLSLAAHQEASGANFEIHEVYVGSTKLIPRSRFRVGQFFLGVGRLNQFHRHDWPFITAPKVHRTFFAEEAAIDGGVEYSWLTPLPFYLDLTVGLTNGWVFGHAHTQGTKPMVPTHYLRAATYIGFSSTGGAQIALNYLGRKDVTHFATSLYGLDATVKWKNADGHSYLFQSEVWYRTETPRDQDSTENFGLYVFPSMPLTGNLSAGVRFDFYTTPGLKDISGASLSNYECSLVPTLTYRTSEFATFRLAYDFTQNKLGDTSTSTHAIQAQAIFIIGAHPAHEF